MKVEICFICEKETGRSGAGEDSLYIELPNGDTLGPYCESCYEKATQDAPDSGK